MASLYELTGELLQLLEMAQDVDCDPQAIEDTLEGLDYEIEAKADGYAKIDKMLQAQIDMCAAEIKRIQGIKKVYENNQTRLKANLEKCMRLTGKTKFKTDLFSFGIQKNPPSLVIDDEKAVPPEYLVIEAKPNKDAIKEALKNGEEISWAHMQQTEGLRIR